MHRYADQSLLALHPKYWRVRGSVQYLKWCLKSVRPTTDYILDDRQLIQGFQQVFSMSSAWPSTSTHSERCYLCYLCWYLNIWTEFSHPVLFAQMAVKMATACCLIDLWRSLAVRPKLIQKYQENIKGVLSILTILLIDLRARCFLFPHSHAQLWMHFNMNIIVFWTSSAVEHFNPLG